MFIKSEISPGNKSHSTYLTLWPLTSTVPTQEDMSSLTPDSSPEWVTAAAHQRQAVKRQFNQQQQRPAVFSIIRNLFWTLHVRKGTFYCHHWNIYQNSVSQFIFCPSTYWLIGWSFQLYFDRIKTLIKMSFSGAYCQMFVLYCYPSDLDFFSEYEAVSVEKRH